MPHFDNINGLVNQFLRSETFLLINLYFLKKQTHKLFTIFKSLFPPVADDYKNVIQTFHIMEGAIHVFIYVCLTAFKIRMYMQKPIPVLYMYVQL